MYACALRGNDLPPWRKPGIAAFWQDRSKGVEPRSDEFGESGNDGLAGAQRPAARPRVGIAAGRRG